MAKGCEAPWTDLIVSSADNRTSCCCFFQGAGQKTFGADGSFPSLMAARNSPEFNALRQYQAGGPHVRGCEGCAHNVEMGEGRRQHYYDYLPFGALSDRQQANLDLVLGEHAGGAVRLESRPLRYLIYFSWFCNLSCTICNEVGTRDFKPDALPDDLFERWRDDLAAALLVDCIGGEPFAIPPAIAFMRKFVADPELASVRLRLTTNGTLLHKHLSWLKAKERVSFNVSIDSIGAGYDTLRVGGRWDQVRDNLLAVRDLIRSERPEWTLGTNALITRTAIPYLPEFARFHVEEGIGAFFQTLRQDRGNEESLYREDVLAYPSLLAEVPGWEDYFDEAIEIFERGTCPKVFDRVEFPDPGASLVGFREQLRLAAVDPIHRADPFGRKVAEVTRSEDILSLMIGNVGKAGGTVGMVGPWAEFTSPDPDFGVVARLNFQGGVPGGGVIGLRLIWPATLPATTRYCHSVVYEVQPFRVLRWTESRDNGERVVDMVIKSLSPAGGDATLLLTLMNARATERNLLPCRLEVWVA